MDINYLLKDVVYLNEYISATQEVLRKCKNSKVNLNITTVLTLQKIRSLEIEYINKCDENGAACILFEQLLTIPPSNRWGVLAKELICLLQYWLDAIRKHLINHSIHWWTFLKQILKFIKEIRLKEPAIPNLLVELTSECLFDLSTATTPDVFQRHEILHCFNMVCAESGREVRFAMRTKFGDYFVKLATQMMTSGYLPGQYSTLECLLRWLVPRHEPSLRAAAADKWLPADLCPPKARDLFLNSTWMNFFQDAREFINALNDGNGLVTSVICRHLSIGKIVVINGTERQTTWLDFNTAGNSISVILDPKVLGVFGVADHRACETLLIDREITESAQLRRELLGLTLSLNTTRAPYIRPTDITIGDERSVSIVVSSRTDLRKIDTALRNTFGDKYQLLLDLDSDISQSPQRSNKNKNYNSEEDSRFSHPVEVKRRKQKQPGYLVKSKNPVALSSPSTSSTTSVIQLRDKLAALPRYKFDKAPVSVCAEPQLSAVSEHTERDERCSSRATTLKFQPYGGCYKSVRPIEKKTSQSDGETIKPKCRSGRRGLSPVVSDDNERSLLLVATVGSADDLVINKTAERLSKSKDFENDSIVNLLVQEALQAKPPRTEVSKSSNNTCEKKSQEKEDSEAIENTPVEKETRKNTVSVKKNCIFGSKSVTDDESNTEVYETPSVNKRNKKLYTKKNSKTDFDLEKPVFHVKTIEEFFSQHVAEYNTGEIVISPTLARKINESSSITSDSFDENYLVMNEDIQTDVEQCIFNEIEIIDCLNDMVDKVCKDFENCAEYLFKGNSPKSVTIKTNCRDEESEFFENQQGARKRKPSPLQILRPKRNTKRKYTVKKTKPRVSKIQNTKHDTIKKMTTITEQAEDTLNEVNPKISNENTNVVKAPSVVETKTNNTNNMKTPIVHKKRKLYSPKDYGIEDEMVLNTTAKVSSHVDDIPLSDIKACINSKKPKITATCYKELEKERKIYSRLPRSKKSKGKIIETPSPRTLKMNTIFDNLKQTVEGNDNIIFVDKKSLNTDVYNFTSDSEDEDFKKKKIEVKKRVSLTAVSSSESMRTQQRRKIRRGKCLETTNDEKKIKVAKRKKVTKRPNKCKTDNTDPLIDLVGERIGLVDEKMRKAAREELITSILHENPTQLEAVEIEPTLKKPPQMEEILDNSESNGKMVKLKKFENILGTDRSDGINNDDELNYPLPLQTVNKRREERPKRIPKKIQDPEKCNDAVPKKRVNKRVRGTELLVIKNEKGLSKNEKQNTILDKDDEGTISPLPGLLVESTPQYKDDVNDSLNINVLQKFKRIYQEGPNTANDSVNTQNMPSDGENDICFVDDSNMKTTEDENKENNRMDKVQKLTKRNPLRKIMQTEKSAENIIVIPESIKTSTNDLSEKSIATDGITAHGDFDEMPPNADTIQEKLKPREILDLDESMKDYFKKLTQEINYDSAESRRESSKSAVSEKVSNIVRNQFESSHKSGISPIVAVKRLSFDDISKWMPSRRTSATDSSPNQIKQTDIKSPDTTPKSTTHYKKSKGPDTSTPDSIELKSPKIPITRMSFEEFDKWLPMPKSVEDKMDPSQIEKSSGLKLVYRTRSKSKVIDLLQITQELSKVENTKRKKVRDQKSNIIETNKKCKEDRNLKQNLRGEYKCKRIRDFETQKRAIPLELESDLDEIHKNKYERDKKSTKSDVSVKKLDIITTATESHSQPEGYFEVEKSNIGKEATSKNSAAKTLETTKGPKKRSKISNVEEIRNESDGVDITKKSFKDAYKPKTLDMRQFNSVSTETREHKIKSIILPVKLSTEIVSKYEINESSEVDDYLTHSIRNIFSKPNDPNSVNVVPNVDLTTTEKESSVPLMKSPTRKRKSDSPISIVSKKRIEETVKKVVPYEEVTISESGPSISSVNDWFRRTRPDVRGHNVSMSFRDTIQNVMEKLDTTLVETNQNTSKKFVNLFVETQKSLEHQKEELRAMYKQVATDLIGTMIQAMDEKFTELDRKSQAMAIDFKEKLKKQACDLIREDCKQKRAMVLLLKEDVQAVIDHIDRSRTTDSP